MTASACYPNSSSSFEKTLAREDRDGNVWRMPLPTHLDGWTGVGHGGSRGGGQGATGQGPLATVPTSSDKRAAAWGPGNLLLDVSVSVSATDIVNEATPFVPSWAS